MIKSFMDDITTIAVLLVLALGNDAQTSPRLPLTTAMEGNGTLDHDTPIAVAGVTKDVGANF